jgi:hypothetical protein
MQYKNEVFTKVLSETDFKQAILKTIQVFRHNNVLTIDLLFGVAWGNEYKDWMPFEVSVDSILDEIKIAEDLKVGRLGDDDLYLIYASRELEVLLCHEHDLHLRYNDSNDLVSAIIKSWKESGIFNKERQLT